MSDEITKAIGGRTSAQRIITQPKRKNYLLAIGIDYYAHCPRLFNAVKDVKDITTLLKERFQFESENIQELYDEEATKRNIYKALDALSNKVTPNDNLLLYFSGHGEYHKRFDSGYWIPVEAEKDEVHEYIPNSEIRKILGAIKSHHTFLMVDSCFSGALFAKGTSRNVSLRKELDPSRWGLTSGRNEIVTDGKQGNNSPFAKSIIYQLQTAIEPLGVATLCDKVLEIVSANANQTPRGEPLKVDGHQGGQFVFHLKKDELADWKTANLLGTIDAYQQFLSIHKEGQYFKLAQAKIMALTNLYEKRKLIESIKERWIVYDDVPNNNVLLEAVMTGLIDFKDLAFTLPFFFTDNNLEETQEEVIPMIEEMLINEVFEKSILKENRTEIRKFDLKLKLYNQNSNLDKYIMAQHGDYYTEHLYQTFFIQHSIRISVNGKEKEDVLYTLMIRGKEAVEIVMIRNREDDFFIQKLEFDKSYEEIDFIFERLERKDAELVRINSK